MRADFVSRKEIPVQLVDGNAADILDLDCKYFADLQLGGPAKGFVPFLCRLVCPQSVAPLATS